MALSKWTFTVTPEDAELRLDQLIAKRTELSRRSAREALKLGGVQVDRKRVKVAGKLVKPGLEVRVAYDPDLPPVPTTPIPIVFEDAWLIAVDKPAGIATQGTWATDRHDLLALLRSLLAILPFGCSIGQFANWVLAETLRVCGGGTGCRWPAPPPAGLRSRRTRA